MTNDHDDTPVDPAGIFERAETDFQDAKTAVREALQDQLLHRRTLGQQKHLLDDIEAGYRPRTEGNEADRKAQLRKLIHEDPEAQKIRDAMAQTEVADAAAVVDLRVAEMALSSAKARRRFGLALLAYHPGKEDEEGEAEQWRP